MSMRCQERRGVVTEHSSPFCRGGLPIEGLGRSNSSGNQVEDHTPAISTK